MAEGLKAVRGLQFFLEGRLKIEWSDFVCPKYGHTMSSNTIETAEELVLHAVPMDDTSLEKKKVRKAKKPRLADTRMFVDGDMDGDMSTELDNKKEKKDKKEKKEKKEKKDKKDRSKKTEQGEKKEKKKREKKQPEEKEECPICIEAYTPVIRKKIECKYCNQSACSKCIERYLLDSIEDAHCLHCKVNYNDSTLREICTMTYVQQVYFKHRQEILLSREKANLPALQDAALDEQKKRSFMKDIGVIRAEMVPLQEVYDTYRQEYDRYYVEYYAARNRDIKTQMDNAWDKMTKQAELLRNKNVDIGKIRRKIYDITHDTDKKEEADDDKKKFIRRCTREECQGFLSTAWKCGLCEYYSCSKCFKVKGNKHDAEHTCVKEDVETAELIKKDCKGCPKCGEFIEKNAGCDMMWCISCKTPFSWNTGKIITHGIIHNPHYYEWLRRNGTDVQHHNPADVPCGGYPATWHLRRMPRGVRPDLQNAFYEFHRLCMEIQDISTRSYRSHIDNATNNAISIRYLLKDYDEKHWGQLLAKNERKRKRDQEVQEIFAAFRMVAVEQINRIQNFTEVKNGTTILFTALIADRANDMLENFVTETGALINMINEAFKQISVNYHYTVPFIGNLKELYDNNKQLFGKNYTNNVDEHRYYLGQKNYYSEVKKKRGGEGVNEEVKDNDEDDFKEDIKDDVDLPNFADAEKIAHEVEQPRGGAGEPIEERNARYGIIEHPDRNLPLMFNDDIELQRAIEASLKV